MKIYKIIEKRNLWFALSVIVILIGFAAMFSRFLSEKSTENILNYGIDFKGGTSLILKFDTLETAPTPLPKETSISFISDLRFSLETFGLDKSRIQITNKKEVLIKTLDLKENRSRELLNQLKKDFGTIEILEIDLIGPTIGAELKSKSLLIILFVSLALLGYISLRFEFSYGISALAALLHDALVTISLASLLELEINTAFVAALLTILGYSINDTIVIFDRIRENVAQLGETDEIIPIINISLSQTLARTINTSITTLIVITTLILLGGSTIKEFCITLLIGILAGTYSSLFIASPVLSKYLKKPVKVEEIA
jgi:preprotein translocase subunit SecF